jgi:hypothetical protein
MAPWVPSKEYRVDIKVSEKKELKKLFYNKKF